MSEGTPEGMFDYKPELVISDPESPPITTPSNPSVFRPDFDETEIDLTVSYPKPPKPSPNIGKILREFESESRSRLHEAMTISHFSANPAESGSAWEAYRRRINSKISRLKNFGYKVSERNLLSGFIPLMEIWKLRNSQLCLPAPEVKELTPEVMEEVDVQEVVFVQDRVVVSGHRDYVMEEATAQMVIFETQQVGVFISQSSAGTSSRDIPIGLLKIIEEIKVDNALVKEGLDI